MKKARSILALLLAAVFCVSMAGCSTSGQNSSSASAAGNSQESSPAEKTVIKIGCVSATRPAVDVMVEARAATQ